MSVLITGAAGFIGVNLVKTFLSRGERVLGVDNLSRGCLSNLSDFKENPLFTFRNSDINESEKLKRICQDFSQGQPISECWHLAANSDIPAGISDPSVDLKDTFMTTYKALEVMRSIGIMKIGFASSSAIYGYHADTTLTENFGPLSPISNYGAMKLASEAAISAAVESFLDQAWIFRFPNIIGTPATHGVIYDFVRKIKKTPELLQVLGDGSQKKSYLHVKELIDAMFWIREHSQEKLALYNIGPDDSGVNVKFIAEETIRNVQPNAKIQFGESNRGWIGDVPSFAYSNLKLKNLGWVPKLNSKQAVKIAIKEIAEQELGN